MRIIDVVQTPIAACAQFEFQGWTISMSTIFKTVRVAAWNHENADEFEAATVEEIIVLILTRGLKSKNKASFVTR